MERSGGNGAGAPSEGVLKGTSLLPAKSTDASAGRASQPTPRPPGKGSGAPDQAGLRTPGGGAGRGGDTLARTPFPEA